MPIISIIIPVYNSGKVLKHCVNSLLNQTFKDIEVILVNDGSVDNSLQVCKDLQKKDSRVVVIDKKNEGRICARRDGYNKSRGEYIAFSDHDDYMAPNAFEYLISIAQKNDLDMVVSNYERVFDNWQFIKRVNGKYKDVDRVIEGEEIYDALFGTDINHKDDCADLMWGRIYRKNCIDEVVKENIERVFPSKEKNMETEDSLFNLAVIPKLKRVWLSNQVLYFWRYGGSSRVNRFHPIITGHAGDYFDLRLEHFKKIGFERGLARTYNKYLIYLFQELHQRIHLGISDKKEVEEIIMTEMNNRPIVKWAKMNLDDTYKDISQMNCMITGDIDLVLNEVEKQYNGIKWHYKLNGAINFYQWLMNHLARIL